jgi:acyl carrier protein
MEKGDIQKFVEQQLKIAEDTKDVSELDSLEKVELIMMSEKEFSIFIPDEEVDNTWNTEDVVNYLYEKINKK